MRATPHSYDPYGSPSAYDDDEERRRREAALLELATPPAPAAAAAPPQPTVRMTEADFAPPAKPERPRFERSPANFERAPQDSGWLNAGLGGLAALLDLATNKGRGMGQIAANAINAESNRLGANQRSREWNADQLARHEDQELRAQQQQIEQQRAAEVHERFLANNDPNNPENKANLEYKQALAAQARANAERDPNAITPQQEREYQLRAEQIRGSAEDRDLQREAMKEARKQAAIDRANALEETKRAHRAGEEDRDLQRTALAQQKATEAKREGEVRAQKDAESYTKQHEFELKALTPLKEAEAILAKYPKGSDVPASGRVDSHVPRWALGAWTGLTSTKEAAADALPMRSAQDSMTNLIQRAESGAAAPIPEQLMYRIRAGSQPGATEDELRQGIAAAKEYITGTLRAGSFGRESTVRSVLDLNTRGGGDYVLGQAPPPPAPRPEDALLELAPTSPGDTVRLGPTGSGWQGRGRPAGGSVNAPPAGDVLPVTDQKRSEIPRVDDHIRANPDGGGTVAMVTPGGKVVQVPAAEVAEAEAEGLKRR